tara:strand:+ start:139 stop:351 length:213 start_codon:yes stop_codon:yes gene_type:complete
MKKKAKQLRTEFYDKEIENSFGKEKANEEAQHYAMICLEIQMNLLAKIGSKKAWKEHVKLLCVRNKLLSL